MIMSLNKKSFTLIELIIVVIIIGILASMGLPGFEKTKEQALDREAKANMQLILAADKIYRMENGTYWPVNNLESNQANINTALKLSLPTDAARKWSYEVNNLNTFVNITAGRTGGVNKNWQVKDWDWSTLCCFGKDCPTGSTGNCP